MGLFFPDYGNSLSQPGGQRISILGVVAGHAALIGLIAASVPADRIADMARPFSARLIEKVPDVMPRVPVPPPKPAPKMAQSTPPPILVANTPTPMPDATAFAVAPQAPVAPRPAPSAAPINVSVTAARFDADYLDNPKPVYPHASRRLGEEGKVLLRVRVSATGQAESVEIKETSGFARLDQAAEEAVKHWRFVPARRGDEAVAAWVQVPITFNLQG